MTHSFNQILNQTEQLQLLLRRLPVIINIILIVACAQLVANAIWMLLDNSSSDSAALTSSVNSMSDKTRSDAKEAQQAFRNLSGAHLFGIFETNTAPIRTDNVPETKLNLVLKGVLAAGSDKIASAIIARGANGQEEIYGINDKIPGGIILREIHPEYVILERQGQLETLRMMKSKGSDEIPTTHISQPSAATLSSTSTQQLKNIRTDLIKNPASFRKYATPVVVRENGKQIGYRLQPQQNSDLLTQAGIEPSDVITSINGVKLNDMKNSITALNALRKANQVSITVKRNGTEVPLNIQLQ